MVAEDGEVNQAGDKEESFVFEKGEDSCIDNPLG